MSAKPTTKQFGKSTREVPASADQAKKWYPADDESAPKKVSCVWSCVAIKEKAPGTDVCISQFGNDTAIGIQGNNFGLFGNAGMRVGSAFEIWRLVNFLFFNFPLGMTKTCI